MICVQIDVVTHDFVGAFVKFPKYGEHVSVLAASATDDIIGRPQELLDGLVEQGGLLVVDSEFHGEPSDAAPSPRLDP